MLPNRHFCCTLSLRVKRFLLIAPLLFSLVQAQSIQGFWRGTLTQEPGGCFPVYHLELHIDHQDGVIKGNSYDYFDTTKYVRLHFTGSMRTATRDFQLRETELLEFKVPRDCVPCIKTYLLKYEKNESGEFLVGSWTGFDMTSVNKNCPPGKITLAKVDRPSFQSPQALKSAPPTLNLEPRTKELVQTIQLPVSDIQIDLYDNAEIDNDTVTVLLNNQVLLRKQRLSNKPHHISFKAEVGTWYELMMYADNLGEIPPNTALMVVTAGNKKYEVRLASSKEKTAVVKFMYQPSQ